MKYDLDTLRGSFTVASSHKLVGVISDDIKDHQVVIFDFAEASYIDDSAAMLIHQLIDVATHENTEVVVASLSGSVADTLDALGVLQEVPADRTAATREDARRIAHRLVEERATGGRRRRAGLTRAACESAVEHALADLADCLEQALDTSVLAAAGLRRRG